VFGSSLPGQQPAVRKCCRQPPSHRVSREHLGHKLPGLCRIIEELRMEVQNFLLDFAKRAAERCVRSPTAFFVCLLEGRQVN